MKSLGGIGAILLGIVAVLVSVGLQTIWAPPATFTATTDESAPAPLTIVTDGVDVDPEGATEYTVTGDGEFTLMYGQLRDIEAWVDDAAHHRIEGIDTDVARGEDPSVVSTFVDGEAEVPNPADSDLWVATQTVTDEVTQRWTPAEEGEWGVLIAANGTDPAPTQFSATWVNIEPDSPWIMPLQVGGIVLIVLGVGLLIWRFLDFRRRAKRTSGRRAAVRSDYTGLTAADVMADNSKTTQSMSVQEISVGEPITPAQTVPETDIPAAEQAADVSSINTSDETLVEPAQDATGDQDQEATETSEQDQDDVQDDDEPGVDDDDHQSPSAESDPEQQEQDQQEKTSTEDDTEEPPSSSFLRRGVAGLSALGLLVGISVGPAHAQPETPPAEESSPEEQATEAEDEPVVVPVVVPSQFERIFNDVVQTVADADEALDAEMLEDRVAGQALQLRKDSYRNNNIVEEASDAAEISSDEILATWMEHDESFPRTMTIVTAPAEEGATQLLVLQQATPRSQYKLIHNVPFAPGVELPGGTLSDQDVENLDVDDSSGLIMSPTDGAAALAEYLADQSADAGDNIADNEWIEAIHEYQADVVENHEDNDITVSVQRNIFEDSLTAIRLPNGSALVFGAMNSLESLTPEDGATVTLDELSQELGDFETAEHESQIRFRYREQFSILIPADGEMALVGYETVQSTVDDGSD